MELLDRVLDAPMANLLIVAGLVFLGIAAIGKVSGKVEPGTGGRILCGVIGLALLVAGIHFHRDLTSIIKRPDKPIANWRIEHDGVCRDASGYYPRWSDFDWPLEKCEAACLEDPTCQGFAIRKGENYCQLFGPNGEHDGSRPGTQITHGDASQPMYSCYVREPMPEESRHAGS